MFLPRIMAQPFATLDSTRRGRRLRFSTGQREEESNFVPRSTLLFSITSESVVCVRYSSVLDLLDLNKPLNVVIQYGFIPLDDRKRI